MTTEQKLQAIIEAQVKGGYESYSRFVEEIPLGSCHVMDRGLVIAVQHTRDWHLLEILLDPQGLRAAYGEEWQEQELDLHDWQLPKTTYEDPTCRNCPCSYYEALCKGVRCTKKRKIKELNRYWKKVADRILDTWLSSNGDASKTIDTAYSLLPE